MTIEKGKLSRNDSVHATITLGGKTIVRLTEAGFESMEDLLKKLRTLTTHYFGLANIYVRNCSQGWSTHYPILLC